MDRRTFLAAGSAAAATGLAGCRSLFQTRSARAPPLVEDRPDAVYYPTHVDGMEMVGTATAGEYGVAVTYTYPHRFWQISSGEPNMIEIESDDSVHLMATVWDRETETVVPTGNVLLVATGEGETVEKRMWSMLSQKMGVHAGDNVALPGEGSYDLDVEIGPLSVTGTGAFADRFGEGVTASLSFEFDRDELESLSFERLTDDAGDRGAVEPMSMDMVPVSTLPEPEAMPGTLLGGVEGGDAVFVVTRLDSPPAGVDADGPYLAVSPRTPYNRYPLPQTSLSATVDGGSAFDGPLRTRFDPDLGYHHGAAVDEVTGEITLSVGAPPGIHRHEGYETAFFEFGEMRLDAEPVDG